MRNDPQSNIEQPNYFELQLPCSDCRCRCTIDVAWSNGRCRHRMVGYPPHNYLPEIARERQCWWSQIFWWLLWEQRKSHPECWTVVWFSQTSGNFATHFACLGFCRPGTFLPPSETQLGIFGEPGPSHVKDIWKPKSHLLQSIIGYTHDSASYEATFLPSPLLVGNTHWSSPSVEWLNFIQHTSNKRNAESPATDWTLSSDYAWAQTELSSSVRRWFDNLTWPGGGRRRGGSLGASGGSSRTRNFLFSTTSPTPAMTEGTISSAGGISRVNLEHSSDFV